MQPRLSILSLTMTPAGVLRVVKKVLATRHFMSNGATEGKDYYTNNVFSDVQLGGAPLQ